MEQREKILDLRKTPVFEKGHIPGSISLPIQLYEQIEKAPKTR